MFRFIGTHQCSDLKNKKCKLFQFIQLFPLHWKPVNYDNLFALFTSDISISEKEIELAKLRREYKLSGQEEVFTILLKFLVMVGVRATKLLISMLTLNHYERPSALKCFVELRSILQNIHMTENVEIIQPENR